MNQKRLFTSEAVTEGHPDKICDQIADCILDELLAQDPMSRCACEVTCEPGAVHIMGEITSQAKVDYVACAREVIRNVGYTNPEYGFDDHCNITCSIHAQSPDIAMGVDHAFGCEEDLGAGDQGMMFGYACSETGNYMPAAIELANGLAMQLSSVRKDGTIPYLRPDGKTQVTVEYQDGKCCRIDTIIISAQHDPGITIKQLHSDLQREVIDEIINPNYMDDDTIILVNPTGRFVLGGPAADTGLTGRKIIADTYGGYARHGGGAFSGKDPTKVDRSAAYMARYIAKNIVAADLASQCEVQLSYSIGVAYPISVSVDTFGTGALVSDAALVSLIRQNFDMRPGEIIRELNLRKPQFLKSAAYGHFGRIDVEFPWECLNKVNLLRHAAQSVVGQKKASSC